MGNLAQWAMVSVADTLADTSSASLGLSAGFSLLILVGAVLGMPLVFWLFVWLRWTINKQNPDGYMGDPRKLFR